MELRMGIGIGRSVIHSLGRLFGIEWQVVHALYPCHHLLLHLLDVLQAGAQLQALLLLFRLLRLRRHTHRPPASSAVPATINILLVDTITITGTRK